MKSAHSGHFLDPLNVAGTDVWVMSHCLCCACSALRVWMSSHSRCPSCSAQHTSAPTRQGNRWAPHCATGSSTARQLFVLKEHQ